MSASAFAPAKVNLYLHVGPPGADGYHPLDSLMVFADVGDEVSISTGPGPALRLTGPFATGLEAGDNLVLLAARQLAQKLGRAEPPPALVLDKRLPVAAGLRGQLEPIAARFAHPRLRLVEGRSHEVLAACDVALVASGRLAPRLGGPPVFPPIPDGATAVGQVKRAWKTSTGEDRHRRGLYTFVYRASPPPALVVFDAPEGFTSCTRRNRSNTPLQALTLLNDPAFVELADALADVVAKEGVEAAFRRCTGRRPDAAELAVLAPLATKEQARVLLNLDETVTRE